MCVSCTAETPMQKDVREAKTRQDTYSNHPEWRDKKVSALTPDEAKEWKQATDTVKRLSVELDDAKSNQIDVTEKLIVSHGLAGYPANYGGYTRMLATADGCAGAIEVLGASDPFYILYTPGGMSCYAGMPSFGGSNWTTTIPTIPNPDVEDRR